MSCPNCGGFVESQHDTDAPSLLCIVCGWQGEEQAIERREDQTAESPERRTTQEVRGGRLLDQELPDGRLLGMFEV